MKVDVAQGEFERILDAKGGSPGDSPYRSIGRAKLPPTAIISIRRPANFGCGCALWVGCTRPNRILEQDFLYFGI